jgi:hypothetical protein
VPPDRISAVCRIRYEAAHVQPDRAFLLYYQRKDAAFGVTLLKQHPELKEYFALGERVLVVLGDEFYETLPENDGGK